MILNRFCIDKDAAFQLSGVKSLKKSSYDMEYKDSLKFNLKRREKRKRVFILTIIPINLPFKNFI